MNKWQVYSYLKMNGGKATKRELYELFPGYFPNTEKEIEEGIAEYKEVSKRFPEIYEELRIG